MRMISSWDDGFGCGPTDACPQNRCKSMLCIYINVNKVIKAMQL